MNDYLSPDEMAELHQVAPNTIYLILRADAKKPEDEKRLPGAKKVGSKYRGSWLIPRSVAEDWKPDPRGRKPKQS